MYLVKLPSWNLYCAIHGFPAVYGIAELGRKEGFWYVTYIEPDTHRFRWNRFTDKELELVGVLT